MEPGTLVAGRFRVLERAGRGGMGIVYRARDDRTGETVALKTLACAEANAAVRFAREARALASLAHPAIVPYVDHGEADGQSYIAMRWVDGEDLRACIQRGPLPVADALAVVRQMASALAHAHALGIVHRDLKPGNVLLERGRIDGVRVVDFGVAYFGPDATEVTAVGTTVGTIGFAAPEQVRGAFVDGRADVFALGCVAYALLTGLRPFRGDTWVAVLGKVLLEECAPPSEHAPNIPASVDALVLSMLAKERVDRPTAAEVIARIDAMLANTADNAPAPVRPVVTSAERRLVSVVVVRGGAAVPRTDDMCAAFGGRGGPLADGTWLIEFVGAGAADQAHRAARCALHLRTLTPDARIVVATALDERTGGRNALGDALESAGRLLERAHAEPDSISVDDVTAGLIDEAFDVDRASSRARLRRETDRPAAMGGVIAKVPSPFVGREPELAAIAAMVADAVEDHVLRVAIVEAPPGFGKSRLRREALHRATEATPTLVVVPVRCDPGAGPLALATRILATWLGLRSGESPDERREKLRASCADLEEAETQRAFLAELLGIADEAEHADVQLAAARRDPMLMSDRIHAAWEAWLAAACERGPHLVTIEDFHLADAASMALIEHAALAVRRRPLAILATARPELPKTTWATLTPQWIVVRELGRRACAVLARALLGTQDEAAVERLVAQSAGNAMYLQELVRAWQSGQREGFPSTLVAMVQARLDAVDAEARRVLRAASVFGTTFWSDGVASLIGAGREAVSNHLQALAGTSLVLERPRGEWEFSHALVREAAYATLPPPERASAHLHAAEWLLHAGMNDVQVLADHFDRGGAPERAARHHAQAAELALQAGDFDAAIRSAEAGLTAATEDVAARLHQVAGDALRWKGDAASAVPHFERALERAPRGSQTWFDIAGSYVLAAFQGARRDAGLAVLSEAIDTPENDAIGAKAGALARAAYELMLRGADASFVLSWIDAHEAEIPASDRVATARIHQARALWESCYGDLAVFLERTRSAACEYRAIGDLRNEAWQLANLGAGLVEIGAYDEAVRTLEELLRSPLLARVPAPRGLALNNLGLALARAGRLDEAERVEREAVEHYATRHHARLEGASRAYLGEILLRRGHLEQAAAETERATTLLENSPALRSYALAIGSLVARERGDGAAALDLAARAAEALDGGASLDEGERVIRWALVSALARSDADAARAASAAAKKSVLARAARIASRDYREVFLNEELNAKLLAT